MSIFTTIGSGMSRAWNVMFHDGHWSETTSARAYREASFGDPAWTRRRDRIDAVFRFLDPTKSRQPHCE